ncbi:MAG: SusC/RagA family TonB-linked outer membrane protein [Bacteroidales bacterium]|nr:SusC/RagA family TonB-linked outer membrane protein [Bacteroidales bacterium]
MAAVATILAASFLGTVASAQNRAINGIVVDESGAPVVGAAVVLVGNTSVGAVTNLDGTFALSVPAGASISVTCIGYAEQVIPVGNQSQFRIVLKEDTMFLDETVVIGYGVQKKSDLTGSVASVRSEDLQNRSTSDAAAALQGKAAGVQVINASGAPGKGADIRVRGYSSNSGSLGPLLIVDGLKVDNIQYLDPEMIESIEVLKDAASAAIYGAEAGNGVVLVTTKTGKKGEGKIFYNNQFTLSTLSRHLDIMRAKDYIDFGLAQGYLSERDITGPDAVYDGVTDVDWSSEIFVPTWSNRHTVGFQGGNDRGHFFASINNVMNDGIFRGDKDQYRRLTFQVNADYKIKDWLTVGTNNSIEKWSTKSVSEANDNGSALLSAITSSPLFPVRGDESRLSAGLKNALAAGTKILTDPETGLYWTVPLIGETQSGHPFVQRDATDSQSGGISVRGVAYLNFMPFKGFTFTSRFGYRIAQNTSHTYTEPYFSTATIKADNYNLEASANTSLYYQWENFANYNRTFGKHDVSAMAGMSFIQYQSDNVWAQATGPDILKGYQPNFQYLSFLKASDTTTKNMSNAPGRSANLSYFARIGYTYDNRYSVQANFRADAFDSSKLPLDKKWGYFPSVSVGWTISNESFIKDNVDQSLLNFLKFRASWGKNGNINVLNNYPYSTDILLNRVWYQYHVDSATSSTGSLPSGLSNPNLRWEESVQTDLGLDIRMFNNRLTLGLDWYNKNTDGLLVDVPSVMEMGIPVFWESGDVKASTTMNAGKVNNRGFEVELGWRDQIGDFSYSVNGNAAWLKNKMTYLEPLVGRLTGRTVQGTYLTTYCEEGMPLWYMKGYNAEGINNEGRVLYTDYDENGERVGTTISPDESDRVYLGKGIPSLTYGITVNLAWKSFDLSIFGTGVAGNNIYPTAFRVDRPSCNTYAYYWNNSWKKPGDEATAKFPAANYWSSEAFSSSLTVFDGSYFKIKQIQLGYTLPQNLTKKVAISHLRVFAMLDNFFTFSKYIGLDPETATTGGNAIGFDMGNFPTAKSVIFGVNLEF